MQYTTDSISPESRAYFSRQLTYVRNEVVKDKKAPQNGFLLLNQASDVPEWAEEYTHEMWEPVGIAQLIANGADDIPMADAAFREETFRVADLGIGYAYTVKELMQSQATGKGVNVKRAEACRFGMEVKMNSIMMFGDPVAKLYGWLTFANTPRLISAIAINGGTPATVLALLNSFVNSVNQLTETVAPPSRMSLAPEDYDYIASTPLDLSGGAETTILTHFMNNNPHIQEVRSVVELKAAGPTGGNLLMVDSPDTFEHKLVMPFTQFEAQPRNYKYVIPAMGRSGGTVTDFPLEALVVELPAA